ncbi:hypothetical protein D3C75_994750 [compost metagenome]
MTVGDQGTADQRKDGRLIVYSKYFGHIHSLYLIIVVYQKIISNLIIGWPPFPALKPEAGEKTSQ